MMVTKIVNTDIDMYGNRVTNLCVEVLPELPETTSEGRLVYLKAARQIFVYSAGSWQSVGELNPTKLSAFENDVGFLTADTAGLSNYYTKDETDERINNLARLQFKVMDALPETGEPNYIYLVPTTSSKSKNVKDEWIWVDGDWELIGSTAFKLDLKQSPDGIVIDGKTLQKASETQDGLMTKEMVKEFRAKQDKLTAGPNISIENGVISAIGGGTGGGHASFVGSFGGDGMVEYTVSHGLGTYNIIFQMRTAPPVRYVQSTVYATDENTLKVVLSEPLNDTMYISILACDISAPEPETFDVETKTISTPMTVWSQNNPTGNAVFCQLFDDTGDELRGDIVQESAGGFSPVVASFDTAYSGTMLVAKATKVIDFADETSIVIDLAQDGLSPDSKYLVQIFTDEMGQTIADVVQDSDSGVIEIDFGGMSLTGFIVLRESSKWVPFENKSEVICQHDLGRAVGVQVYLNGTGQTFSDVKCTSENSVTISMGSESTGYIVIL